MAATSQNAGLVVLASPATWGRWWRRELSQPWPLCEVQTHDQAWRQLQAWPHGALALELWPQSAPQTVQLLARLALQRPHVLCLAHLAPELADWELLLREAGAVDVLCSPRRMRSAAALVDRHLARAPSPPRSLSEQIRAKLPWGQPPLAAPAL
jgi:hypothetical protein